MKHVECYTFPKPKGFDPKKLADGKHVYARGKGGVTLYVTVRAHAVVKYGAVDKKGGRVPLRHEHVGQKAVARAKRIVKCEICYTQRDGTSGETTVCYEIPCPPNINTRNERVLRVEKVPRPSFDPRKKADGDHVYARVRGVTLYATVRRGLIVGWKGRDKKGKNVRLQEERVHTRLATKCEICFTYDDGSRVCVAVPCRPSK